METGEKLVWCSSVAMKILRQPGNLKFLKNAVSRMIYYSAPRPETKWKYQATNLNSLIIATYYCEKDERSGQQCQMFCKLMLNNN